MRPAGKARRPRILGIFEGGATPPDGMQRRPNAKRFPRYCTKAVPALLMGSRRSPGRQRSGGVPPAQEDVGPPSGEARPGAPSHWKVEDRVE